MARVYLSVPHMGGNEERYVREAFASNWLSTVGPQIDAFERALAERIGRPAVALSSGTAALHLGLRLLGVGPEDEVLVSDLTFVASVNPIRYLGARPVLVDSDPETWMMSPALLAEALEDRVRRGRRPRAVLVVHLCGQSADMDPILEACRRHDVPILEDAAEAMGTLYKGKPAGSFGEVAAFSFNGNKIITASGGGMLVAQRQEWVDKARFWSTQARDPGVSYHHTEIGHNYRMSNVLAAIGRGQLEVLDERMRQRRAVAFRYRDAFTARDIEARPLWKPMHMQPIYRDCERYGGDVSERLFEQGLCLPSSSSLTPETQDRVIDVVSSIARGRRHGSIPAAAEPAASIGMGT